MAPGTPAGGAGARRNDKYGAAGAPSEGLQKEKIDRFASGLYSARHASATGDP